MSVLVMRCPVDGFETDRFRDDNEASAFIWRGHEAACLQLAVHLRIEHDCRGEYETVTLEDRCFNCDALLTTPPERWRATHDVRVCDSCIPDECAVFVPMELR